MKYAFVFLLIAQSISSSGAVNLRTESNTHVQSNSSFMSSFSQINWNSTISKGVWNNRFSSFIQNDIEMTKANPPKVSKLLYVICSMIFGCCGVDRCFMGQVCLGACKGLTLGGFMIWHLIDYFVCLSVAFSKSEDIHIVGYHATFEKSSIEPAFIAAIIIFILQLLQYAMNVIAARKQAALQAQVQEDVWNQMKAADAEATRPDVPTRQQSLAYIPTRLTKGLRGVGLVAEKPSMPELIAAFDTMDKNGDGLLDHDEIKEALKAMGASDDAVDEMIKCADTDGDGKISKNEFIINATQQASA